MFGFDPEEAKELGSAGRYKVRIEKFKARGVKFPHLQHYFWWIVHNIIAHSMLAIPCNFSFNFHDWTSRKLNADIDSFATWKKKNKK
jgi:hypothetical protein